MLNSTVSTKSSDGCGIDTRTKSIRFLTNLFRKKKPDDEMQKHSSSVTVARVPSTLSVRDILVSTYPSSPALSTPARTRDIDSDMEALRISRHDNPFLKQVLASRESLADSLEESESDDTILMSQEYLSELDTDPLSLPEVHEHMIRSPPPTSWPRSPNFKMFRFPEDGNSVQEVVGRKSPMLRSSSPRQDKLDSTQDEVLCRSLLSPKNFAVKPHQRSSSDIRGAYSEREELHTFNASAPAIAQ